MRSAQTPALDPFVRAVVDFATLHDLIAPDAQIVVALSGGADSCALLLALCKAAESGDLPRPVGAAHFHHGLRGADADTDAAFCASLCTRLALPCVIGVGKVDTRHQSPNAAARTQRYYFLQEAAKSLGADIVATAHTASDQAETVLGRVLRGTSVDGLGGIPVRRTLSQHLTIIRPLLALERRAVEAYCADRGIAPRHDPSNDKPRYARSRLRQRLPDLAEGFNPRLTESLNRLAAHARVDSDLLNRLAQDVWKANLLLAAPGMIRLRGALTDSDPALRNRVLLRALRYIAAGEGDSAAEVSEELATTEIVETLNTLLRHQSGGVDLPGGVRAEMVKGILTLATPVRWHPAKPFDLPLLVPGTTYLPIALRIRAVLSGKESPRIRRSGRIDLSCGTIATDSVCSAAGILRVRTPQIGDRMTPLGMRGSRLVRDIMADAGWQEDLRVSAPLVARADTDAVLWIIGLAQAESTRVKSAGSDANGIFADAPVLSLRAEWNC